MEVFVKGSVEPLMVPVRDRLGNITDLNDVSNLLFDIKRKSDGVMVQTNSPVDLDPDFPMWALCAIDTTLLSYEAGDEYHLYLKYTTGTLTPVLGHVAFRVEAD